MLTRVSIIVPVYNAGSYLNPCIDSILSQSYNDIRVILVDDGSTDDSGAICEKYASLDSRVRCVHQPNSGQSKALKTGYSLSEGEWLFFVDADDTLPKDAVESMITCANDETNIVVGFSYADNGSVCKVDADEWCRMMVKGSEIWCTRWGKLFRRALFDGSEFNTDAIVKVGEDMLMNVTVALRNQLPVTILRRQVYHYRKPASSLTSNYIWSVEKYGVLFSNMFSLLDASRNQYMPQLVVNGVGMIRDLCVSSSLVSNRIRQSKLHDDIVECALRCQYKFLFSERLLLYCSDCILLRLLAKFQRRLIIARQYIARYRWLNV